MRARHFAKKLACLGMTIRQQFSRYARDKDFHFELMGALTFAFMLGVALRLAMRLHDRPLAAVISIGGYVLLFWLLQMIGVGIAAGSCRARLRAPGPNKGRRSCISITGQLRANHRPTRPRVTDDVGHDDEQRVLRRRHAHPQEGRERERQYYHDGQMSPESRLAGTDGGRGLQRAAPTPSPATAWARAVSANAGGGLRPRAR